jgi:T4 RnlA family RNA ligase
MKLPFSIEDLKENIKQKQVISRKHPKYDLWIYNYAKIAAYARNWNSVTINCRGLVLDADYNVIARGFPKFFNYGEHGMEGIPDLATTEKFDVFEKEDGSLGIGFTYNDEFIIATRGSFDSEQAQKANQVYHDKYASGDSLPISNTFLFEIIYPRNRIVVDYGEEESLRLLASIDLRTNKEVEYEKLADFGFPVVKRYDELSAFDDLFTIQKANAEGYVVQFKSGDRCKVKFEEYVRLHRIVTGLNDKVVWAAVRDNEADLIRAGIAEEFHEWFDGVRTEIERRHALLLKRVHSELEECLAAVEIDDRDDYYFRKFFARIARDRYPKTKHFLFGLLSHGELVGKRSDKLYEMLWTQYKEDVQITKKGDTIRLYKATSLE